MYRGPARQHASRHRRGIPHSANSVSFDSTPGRQGRRNDGGLVVLRNDDAAVVVSDEADLLVATGWRSEMLVRLVLQD